MTVASPDTLSPSTGCPSGTLAAPATGPLPANGVIFVENVPSSGANYSPAAANCTSGGSASSPNPLGYPQYYNVGGTNVADQDTYGCNTGDAYVSGTVKGQVTIGTDNNVYVVGNLRYDTSSGSVGTNVVGLIANNFTYVYHPVGNCSGTTCNLLATPVTTIDAALLDVSDSFLVQNYAAGPPVSSFDSSGNCTANCLNVFGSIVQRFRGPVATSSGTSLATGYLKNYGYDTRLQYLSPPHYLQPAQAAWLPRSWAEGKPAYPAP
jgi:hypothetical protein